MSNYYTIRIDHVDDDTPVKLRNMLDCVTGSYVVMSEYGSKTGKLHYQGWVCTDTKVDALRRMRQRKLPENAGREKHSIASVKDVESYKRYVCKGESPTQPPKLFAKCGIQNTDEYIKSLFDQYWKERPKTKTGKFKNTMKCTMDEIVEYFKSFELHEVNEVDVMKRIVEANLENGRPIFDHVQLAMYRNVMCRLYPFKYAVDYCGSLLRKSRNIFFE